CKQALEFPWTF
nr:immunoglobulin light chain junction region [Macaca mulatta]